MTKWDNIQAISECGRKLNTDGILGLLEWCGKSNTASVTLEETELYLEQLSAMLSKAAVR